jgi:hypothetical protein
MPILVDNQLLEDLKEILDIVSDRLEQEFKCKRE